MIGKKINNYSIEKLLGEGGMGNVYLARHEGMDRLVAIKAILPELIAKEDVKKRFLIEASTMSKLQHQNIVTLFDYVSNEDGLFLIMEFVDGIPLDAYMKNLGQPIEEELAIEFTKQIVSACNHAHERGVVHRDIKPQNVMITSDGDVKILDFGIAKMMNDEVNNLTKTGTQLGTVYYMSPEQVKGEKITPATDIYAIGVSLYQMVTGVKPYSDLTTEYQIYDRIVKEDLPDPLSIRPNLSTYVGKVISKATRKNPSDRFKNCDDFLKVLNENEKYREKYANQPSGKTIPPKETVAKDKAASKTINGPKLTATQEPQKKRSNGIYILTSAIVLGSIALIIFLVAGVNTGNDSSSQYEEMSEPKIQDFSNNYSGNIGNEYQISMELTKTDNILGGYYIYARYGKRITISGTIDKDGGLTIREFIKNGTCTGIFEGTLENDQISGNWSKPDGSKVLTFSLVKDN